MDHVQSYLSQPLFSPPDDLSFADCELYPSEGEVEVDPYTRTRTSHLRQHLSEIEDSTKGYYLAPSYPVPSSFHGGAGVVAGSNEPFPDYHIASCFKEISTLKPLPAHSGNGAGGGAHSDALASPWTAHLSSPPTLDSPCSSSNWDNIGCYTSPPPYNSDELMIPPVDEYEYPSPGGLAAVAPRQVQIEPDHQSMEGDVPMESQTIPLLDCLNDESEPEAVIPTSLPIDDDIPPVEPGLQARSPQPPPSKPKRSSTDGVHKPKRGLLHRQHRHTRIPSHMRTPPEPTSAPPKSPGKPPAAAAAARSRVFTCSFARYGCDSTFGSKNEWKRHVASQHLQLGFYRCDVDKCNIHCKGPNQHNRQHHKKSRSHLSNDTACRIANDFNRKDLFTQHLRRMHAPWVQDGRTIEPRLPLNRERDAFERSLNDIRERCWHQQRKPPQCSQCGFCAQKFRGEHSWDERMEHVGRHYERDEQPDVEREDVGLRQWAVQEGIIRPMEEGRWILSSLCE